MVDMTLLMQHAQETGSLYEVEPSLLFPNQLVQLQMVEQVSIRVELEVVQVIVFTLESPFHLGHETQLLMAFHSVPSGLTIHFPIFPQLPLADHFQHK